MSRFFHTLVVAGAAISAAACGGKSESHDGGEGATGGAGGSGGTGLGGSAASGGTAAYGGTGGGATAGGGSSGGTVPATGGTGGGGGAGRGGGAGTGGLIVGGGAGGTSGTGVIGPFPEPKFPTSQWDCTNSYMGCVGALGVTAHQLTGDCPVDESLPRSAAYCATDEIYSCMLAVTTLGEAVLVNCQCWTRYDDACAGCISLNHRNGEPVSCTDSLKICECAYTGILR